ncbi:MAG: carboxypeptidase regulatory-like domain-containing protein [Acidobacteria bacterium]|nr:carboxypeptidase regulatory-like domain-containing protein [Acidobacteriota bacterium]
MNFRVVRTLCALSLFSFSLFSQGTTSRLLGVVTDGSGAAIVDANVTLTNEGTAAAFRTKTTVNGSYAFESIQPGTYDLTVEASGFKKFSAKGNRVTIGQPATVNVTLQLGTVTEVVEVSGAAEVVQTATSGNHGQLLDEKTIKDLPIVGTRGRNPLQLLEIQPGVVNGANTGGGIHIHGARDRSWNFTLDGIDVNETSAGGSNFTPLRPNPDMLAEFRVLTGNFTADSGRNSGGQVAMVTKSGTNELHGSGFWLYRTPRFNANEWESNLNNVGKRQFVQHTFGGTLGGPVIRNKTFFFASGQGLKALETAIVTRTVYTEQMRQGNFRFVTNGRNLPAGVAGASVDFSGNPTNPGVLKSYNIFNNDPLRAGQDKTIAAIIAQTPLPNRFDFGDGLNTAGYNFTAGQFERQNDIVMKVDHIFDNQNTIYFRYGFGRQDSNCDRVNGGQPLFPNSTCLVNTERTPRNLAVNWRTNPTPAITNEFVIGFNKFGFIFDQPLASLSNYSLTGAPVTVLTDYSFGNNRSVRTAQFVDNFSWIKGAHSFKFGLNARLQREVDDRGSVGGQNANPSVNFSTTVNPVDPVAFGLPADINTANDRPALQSNINFLLGRVGQRSAGFVAQGDKFVPGRFAFVTDYPEYDLYVQDNWRVKKNLTIDLGLRWEAKLSASNIDNRIRRPDVPLVAGAAGTTTAKWVNGKLYDNDMNNFGPSVGFAWDPFGTGKTSIRSNFRTAFDRIPTFLFASTIFPNLPGETIGVTDQTYGQSGGRLAGLQPIAPPAQSPSSLAQPAPFSNNTITVVDPNFRSAVTNQWSFSFQREILKRTVLEVSYFGRRGYGLMGAYNANQVDIYKNGFLQGFNEVKAGRESALLNRVLSADSRINPGESASRMIQRLFPSDLTNNNAGGLAANFAARLQNGRSVTDLSGAGPNFFWAYPQFSTVNTIDSNDFSTYNGVELLVERRFSTNLFVNANYTFSKSLDTRSFDPAFTVANTGAAQSASSTPFDINNRRLNYARSDFDRTHAFKSTFSYDLPFGRGQRFGSSASRTINYAIGGWRVAGIFTLTSGRPFSVYSGYNTSSNVVNSLADCTGCTRKDGAALTDPGTGLVFYFDQAQRNKFSFPAAGSIGNTSRNFFESSRFVNFDTSVAKNVIFAEKYNLEIRADVTNLTNTPTFGFPTATLSSATFGRIRDTVLSTSRKIQLGARFSF